MQALSLLAALALAAGAGAQQSRPSSVPLRTRFFAEGLAVAVPRAEYPRPDLVRDDWLCLNGEWELALGESEPFTRKVRVPFAPETELSGVGLGQQVLERCRYRRTFRVPEGWRNRRIVLRFEAVDWEARVRVDGKEAGVHRGGYDRFAFDVTDLLADRPEHELEVAVWDPADPKADGWQPRGKQLGSHGIWYTRTTGIWRSVWLEPVPVLSIERLQVATSHEGDLKVRVELAGAPEHAKGCRLLLQLRGNRGPDSRPDPELPADGTVFHLRMPGVEPWSPEEPRLYPLAVTLVDPANAHLDHVESYVGFRSVDAREGRLRLNGKPRFVAGVLDQGYWPESGMTAPSDAALEADVRLVKELGLDLARKHVKVEDARWYWHCDRLGVLVMQDMPSSMSLARPEAKRGFAAELRRVVEQLASHPAVVHWVVFNEDWGHPVEFQDECVRLVRELDPTRPITDASGWTQRDLTDVVDVHDYGPDLARHGTPEPGPRAKLIGECGGVAFSLPGHRWSEGWGYTSAATADGFVRRVGRLAARARAARNLSGFVWTQLSDVEQELNGLVHYDRTPKVELARLAGALRGTDPEPRRLGIMSWQVLGPIPSGTTIASARDDARNREQLARALDARLVPGEPELGGPGAVTVAGKTYEWVAVTPRQHAVDLARHAGASAANCVCYAVGTLVCERREKVRLAFGSDDAARVWLDGKQVHRVVAVRGTALGDDEVEGLVLEPGAHTVVVKVAQGVFGFGFALCFEVD